MVANLVESSGFFSEVRKILKTGTNKLKKIVFIE